MTNNELLHKLKQILDYDDQQMLDVFTATDFATDIEQVSGWVKSHGDATHSKVEDKILATFLNGLINQLRGKKDGPQPVAEDELSHNAKLMKLKIAFNLQGDELLELFELAELSFSKHEVSAFFRKPGSKHFRPCKDDTLRAFITGLAVKRNSAAI
ncbi:MAG: DUF1456 family protein [Pseudomonadales bacterium]|nr:DUF1456 family protein [Pseudomonadales bacterium]